MIIFLSVHAALHVCICCHASRTGHHITARTGHYTARTGHCGSFLFVAEKGERGCQCPPKQSSCCDRQRPRGATKVASQRRVHCHGRNGSRAVLQTQLLPPQNRVRNTPDSRHDSDGPEQLRGAASWGVLVLTTHSTTWSASARCHCAEKPVVPASKGGRCLSLRVCPDTAGQRK